MEKLHALAIRFAPGLSGILTGYGIAGNHAEMISIGIITAMVVGVEFALRKKGGQ